MRTFAQFALMTLGAIVAFDAFEGLVVALGWRHMTVDEWYRLGPSSLWTYHAPWWVHALTVLSGVAAFVGGLLWLRASSRGE